MKTASIRQIRSKFPTVLRMIQNGESVAITSRRKIVATLTPPPAKPLAKRPWADVDAYFKRLLAQPRLHVSGAEIIREDRDSRS
jgi:antitoxin (DNA-binding transcriptional repressor) of toxin-antitoxin stability system